MRCALGDLLIEAKEAVVEAMGSGAWLSWLADDDNFKGSEDTAQLYMRLARNRGYLTERAEDDTERVRSLSLREARRELTAIDTQDSDTGEGPEPPPEQPQPPPEEEGEGELEPTILRGGPPDKDALAESIGEGRPAAYFSDVPGGAGKQKALREAKRFIDAAGAAEGAKHFVIFCSSDTSKQAALEREIRRPARRRVKKPRDPIAFVLPLLGPGLARKASGGHGGNRQVTPDILISRENREEPRLMLRRGGLLLSVPVPEETVRGLKHPIMVDELAPQYKSAAGNGETVRFVHDPRTLTTGTLPRRLEEGGEIRFHHARRGLTISGGSRRYELLGYDEAEAPGYPGSPGEEEFGYEAGELKAGVERALTYTAADDDLRPALRAVLFEALEGGGTRLVATNSYMAIWDGSLGSDGPGEDVLIPAGDLGLLSRILAKAEPEARVSFSRVGDALLISGKLADGTEYELASRPVDIEFPDYRRLVPKEHALARFGVPIRVALEAAEAALPLAEGWDGQHASDPLAVAQPVCVEFGEESATISLRSGRSEIVTTIDARCPSATVRAAALNPYRLVSALKTARPDVDGWVWIGLVDGTDVGRWTEQPVLVGEDMLVMPMRAPRI